MKIFYQGRLENFRQQWKKEVNVNNEEWQEENSSESVNVNNSEVASSNESACQKLERDIEKRVRIQSVIIFRILSDKSL